MNTEAHNSRTGPAFADALFKKGMFAEAERIYSNIHAEDPKDFPSALHLGRIALLSNRLDDAHKWLTIAAELKPDDSSSKALLAEVFYRRDKFRDAALLLRAIGREAKARKLESFKDRLPYKIEGTAKSTSLRFIMTDPLPVVEVQVNSSDPVNFFIDTGGAEVVVDKEFAREVGVAQFGSETGTFAGGKQAGFEQGSADAIVLNDLVVKNIPVTLMDVRQFSQPIFGGKRVDGIIGTVLIYHFLATMDYPKGELVLQPKTQESLQHFIETAEKQGHIVVPFWMAGDHYMVAWGTVNRSQPMLFFADTGLAGGGFTCPESTLKEAGIQLQENKAGEGIGGGGKVRIIPFVAEELTLGKARERNIQGSYTAAFPLENALGFHIGGLISHGFFRHYALTMDFTGMKYYLKRTEKHG